MTSLKHHFLEDFLDDFLNENLLEDVKLMDGQFCVDACRHFWAIHKTVGGQIWLPSGTNI